MQVVVADSSVDTGQAEQILIARLRALDFVLQELGLTLFKTTQVHQGHLVGQTSQSFSPVLSMWTATPEVPQAPQCGQRP